MVTRLFRVMICHRELTSTNLHDLSMRWSWEVIGQFKYIISPPAEDPSTYQTRQSADLP